MLSDCPIEKAFRSQRSYRQSEFEAFKKGWLAAHASSPFAENIKQYLDCGKTKYLVAAEEALVEAKA